MHGWSARNARKSAMSDDVTLNFSIIVVFFALVRWRIVQVMSCVPQWNVWIYLSCDLRSGSIHTICFPIIPYEMWMCVGVDSSSRQESSVFDFWYIFLDFGSWQRTWIHWLIDWIEFAWTNEAKRTMLSNNNKLINALRPFSVVLFHYSSCSPPTLAPPPHTHTRKFCFIFN